MSDCLTPLCLAALLDDGLLEQERETALRHLGSCSACAALIEDLICVRAQEDLEILPVVGADEKKKLIRVVRAVMAKSCPIPPVAASRREGNKQGGFLVSLATGITGMSTAALAQGAAASSGIFGHIPRLAAPSDKNRDPAVRNSDLADSYPSIATPMEEQGMSTVQPAPTMFGAPASQEVSENVKQSYDSDCAVRAQELILRDFGFAVTEDSLCAEATAAGWYDPKLGTSTEHVGNLLEAYGVPVNRFIDANIFTLTSELAQGHKIIAGVDADELWHSSFWQKIKDMLSFEGANHAVIVSGIDTTNPDDIRVTITDPGSGDVAASYPMEQFLDSWRDSHCMMVSTKAPAPSWLPEMSNFNYAAGHVDRIGALSFDTFSARYGDLADAPAHSLEYGAVDGFLQAVADTPEGGVPPLHEDADSNSATPDSALSPSAVFALNTADGGEPDADPDHPDAPDNPTDDSDFLA